MKRILALSAVFAAGLLLLSACSSSQTSATAKSNSTKASGAVAAYGSRVHIPDFGQPQGPADVRGLVTSVLGNQVTVLKLPQNNFRHSSSTDRFASSTPNQNGTASRGASLSLGSSGGGRGGFYRGGGRPGGSGSSTDRATMIANLEAQSTGSETITVPVGIKMLKSGIDPTTNKRSMVEANLSDITPDSMITVWLNPTPTTSNITNSSSSTTSSTTSETTNAKAPAIASFVLISGSNIGASN